MQCQRVSSRVGPTVRPGVGNAYEARCSYDSVECFDGEHLCRRHVNLAKRDKLITEHIYANNLHCPDHPDRKLRIGGRGKLLFCSARVDTGARWGPNQYCRYHYDLPQTLLNSIERLCARKGNYA